MTDSSSTPRCLPERGLRLQRPSDSCAFDGFLSVSVVKCLAFTQRQTLRPRRFFDTRWDDLIFVALEREKRSGVRPEPTWLVPFLLVWASRGSLTEDRDASHIR